MHFSASGEESPLQTDAKTGGETGRGDPTEGHLGISAAPRLGEAGGRITPALQITVGADFSLPSIPFSCAWNFRAACTESLSPCLRQALGRVVCPRLNLPPGDVPMCANAQARGDGANSFLRLTRNRLMARSSDYSYLSLRNGNHILKLPGFF